MKGDGMAAGYSGLSETTFCRWIPWIAKQKTGMKQAASIALLHVRFLLYVLFSPTDRGDMLFRNIG
jgi:hypothetical protein